MFLVIQKDTEKHSFFKSEDFAFYSEFTTLQDLNKKYEKGKHKYIVDCSGSLDSGTYKIFLKRGLTEYKGLFLTHKGEEVNYVFFDYELTFEKAKFMPEGLRKAELLNNQMLIKEFFLRIVQKEQRSKDVSKIDEALKQGIDITSYTGDKSSKKRYVLVENISNIDLDTNENDICYIAKDELTFVANIHFKIMESIGLKTNTDGDVIDG